MKNKDKALGGLTQSNPERSMYLQPKRRPHIPLHIPDPHLAQARGPMVALPDPIHLIIVKVHDPVPPYGIREHDAGRHHEQAGHRGIPGGLDARLVGARRVPLLDADVVGEGGEAGAQAVEPVAHADDVVDVGRRVELERQRLGGRVHDEVRARAEGVDGHHAVDAALAREQAEAYLSKGVARGKETGERGRNVRDALVVGVEGQGRSRVLHLIVVFLLIICVLLLISGMPLAPLETQGRRKLLLGFVEDGDQSVFAYVGLEFDGQIDEFGKGCSGHSLCQEASTWKEEGCRWVLEWEDVGEGMSSQEYIEMAEQGYIAGVYPTLSICCHTSRQADSFGYMLRA
ncbi:hypothetical protein BS50DRAFT_149333 [Corynespora cassiicola Philippines]|uniref:Uncharacterized protein n=1 Tax=Corynespora cassiicola Philippines TaxID=1448308 RepID=A0A2T2N8L6_CORCC|nr:hypothetical protein BS50DRAFT_149333 [Corynespora cassiicola Philippines]